jgi:hypothetical protein
MNIAVDDQHWHWLASGTAAADCETSISVKKSQRGVADDDMFGCGLRISIMRIETKLTLRCCLRSAWGTSPTFHTREAHCNLLEETLDIMASFG